MIFTSIAMTDKSIHQGGSGAHGHCCEIGEIISETNKGHNRIYDDPMIELSYGYLDEGETDAPPVNVETGAVSTQSFSSLITNGYQPIRNSTFFPPVIAYKITLKAHFVSYI